MTRFGVPSVLVFDNTAYFYSTILVELALDTSIILKYYSNYYPPGNGVVNYTNKNLIRILKNIVVENHRN